MNCTLSVEAVLLYSSLYEFTGRAGALPRRRRWWRGGYGVGCGFDSSKTLKFTFTVKILKFGTPQTIAIIVLKIEKFNVTLH